MKADVNAFSIDIKGKDLEIYHKYFPLAPLTKVKMSKIQNLQEYFSLKVSYGVLLTFTITVSTLYFLWKVVIYPNYFSPLRVIPGPTKQHWFWGNTKQIYAEEAGSLYIDWTREVNKCIFPYIKSDKLT